MEEIKNSKELFAKIFVEAVKKAHPEETIKEEEVIELLESDDDFTKVFFDVCVSFSAVINGLAEKKIKEIEQNSREVLCVLDAGGQGMRDVGLMGVFDSKEKVVEAIGKSWCSVRKLEINQLYPNGIDSSKYYFDIKQ